ncbi:membrane protein insertion efficiency factor YidD [Bacillus megaterium]|nr:membrane protein insertion efficiency factor YidD [Priestia megaterium]
MNGKAICPIVEIAKRTERNGDGGQVADYAHPLLPTISFPLKPPTCRFYPTCSLRDRSGDAVWCHQRGWLTVKRILKCHPFHPGGFDPVPENHKKTEP